METESNPTSFDKIKCFICTSNVNKQSEHKLNRQKVYIIYC